MAVRMGFYLYGFDLNIPHSIFETPHSDVSAIAVGAQRKSRPGGAVNRGFAFKLLTLNKPKRSPLLSLCLCGEIVFIPFHYTPCSLPLAVIQLFCLKGMKNIFPGAGNHRHLESVCDRPQFGLVCFGDDIEKGLSGGELTY